MEKGTLLVGEPMGLFIAEETGALEDINHFTMALAGAEFNVAVGLSRLGHRVGYYTKLGDDPFGKRIVKMMKAEGISTDLIQYSAQRPTGFMMKSKTFEGDPRIFYFRKNSAASTLSGEDIARLDFSRYDAIHMTGITPALSDSTREATALLAGKARERGMLFSFDPNLRPQLWPDQKTMADYMKEMAGKCDIYFPGINEAKIILGLEEPEAIARACLDLGSKAVVVKLGGRGAYYAAANGEAAYVPGYRVEKVVDTVGAGDGFAVGVLSALGEGLPLREAVLRGNAVGAIQVTCVGDNDGLPTREELERFMADTPRVG